MGFNQIMVGSDERLKWGAGESKAKAVIGFANMYFIDWETGWKSEIGRDRRVGIMGL